MGGLDSKESAYNAGDTDLIPGLWRSPGNGLATHFSILAWRIPWTEEPGGLQPMGWQVIAHDWATNTFFSLSDIMILFPYIIYINIYFWEFKCYNFSLQFKWIKEVSES